MDILHEPIYVYYVRTRFLLIMKIKLTFYKSYIRIMLIKYMQFNKCSKICGRIKLNNSCKTNQKTHNKGRVVYLTVKNY